MASPAPLYVRVADSQAVFGIHRSTIYKLAQRGQLTIHKVGAASLLRVAEVEDMIRSGEKSLGDPKGG